MNTSKRSPRPNHVAAWVHYPPHEHNRSRQCTPAAQTCVSHSLVKRATAALAHLGVSSFRNCFHIEPFCIVVLHGAKADDGDAVPFLLNDFENVFGSNDMLAFSWLNPQ